MLCAEIGTASGKLSVWMEGWSVGEGAVVEEEVVGPGMEYRRAMAQVYRLAVKYAHISEL